MRSNIKSGTTIESLFVLYSFVDMNGFIVNLRIQSEYRKIRTRKNSIFGHFSLSECFDVKFKILTENVVILIVFC